MASTELCLALDLLPMELWVKVLKHLLPPELKAIRAVSSSLGPAASKNLFHEVGFRPTVQSTDKIRGITDPGNHKALHRYVKSIEFDIEPLYDEKTLGWMYRGKKLIPAHKSLLHFGTRAFRDAIKVFQHVHTIKITTNHLCARSHPDGLDNPGYTFQIIIFQVLEVVHQLKSTVRHVGILSGGVAQINLSDLLFLPYEHVHIENHIPAVPRLPKLTEAKINSTLAQLPPLRSLDIDLFDMAYGRLPRENLTLNGLKIMLSRSAPELLSLSVSLATPGEHPGTFHRNNCWSHRRDDPAFRIYWTDLFGDTTYPKLAKISLRNVAYFGGEVGQYLRDNASILQSVHLATWDCNTALPSRQVVHTLWNASKEALSLLTLEACGDQHKQLCRAQECGDHVKRYYTINAAKLAEMMLFQNTPIAALERVIFYELLIGIEDSDRSWWYRTNHIGRPHFTYLESGAEAVTYRNAMETLTADELSYRGTVKKQLVLEYNQTIKDAGGQRMGIDLLQWIPNMQLFVFICNDEPGLFLWTKWGFQHFVTVGEGDGQSKLLQRDVETDWLNAMLPITNPYGSLRVPTFPLSTEEPEGHWSGICYFNDSLPDQYDMDYRIDVPDLEGKREEARLLTQYNPDEAERLEMERVKEEEELKETEEREAADQDMALWFQAMRTR